MPRWETVICLSIHAQVDENSIGIDVKASKLEMDINRRSKVVSHGVSTQQPPGLENDNTSQPWNLSKYPDVYCPGLFAVGLHYCSNERL